ncbi:MAG: class I SAM-dependent methyltransferase [Chloroflexota bacterium]
MLNKLGGGVNSFIWKYWYPFVTNLTQGKALTFLNYGYINSELKLDLEADDEGNRPFIQLYHHNASFINLDGKDVVEISAGHGGGASYIARYLKPKHMLGLERNPKAVKFAENYFSVPNLSFTVGDAHNLHLETASADVVVNVEASHAYGQPENFLAEVNRVLRSGGHFLTTDFRSAAGAEKWRGMLLATGMEMIREEEITTNVVDSLDSVNETRGHLIESNIPKVLRGIFRQFAGMQGSTIYEHFKTGRYIYKTYALRKG